MCGIAGIYHYATDAPVDESILRRMTGVLRHRGPDDEGYHLTSRVGLGHRRLSIIDPAGGHQPIYNEDGTIAVVLNGEIYNYRELAEHLESCGHRLKTRSDTETIVHLYEDYGEACLSMLRGMFAFALWDGRKRQLMLARDRLGKKPLYFADICGRMIFGSELKALLEDSGLSRRLDVAAMADYLSYQYIPAPRTIYEGIKKLRAGHYLIVRSTGVQDREYWDVDFSTAESHDEGAWCTSLIEALHRSVSQRMESDVPIGAFLSSGVDSSSIVAMMNRVTEQQVVTVSVGFEEEAYSEAADARWFAQLHDTEHHEIIVRPQAVNVIERLSWYFDEPFADASAVPAWCLANAAREFVTVALSGDGGDENFAGYRRYLFDAIENRVRKVAPLSFRRPLFGALAAVYPDAAWLPQPLRARATLRNLTLDPAAAYYNSVYGAMVDHRDHLLGRDLRKELGDYDPFEVFLDHFNRARTDDPIARVQYVDFKTYLTDDVLTKVDRSSMANSLEVRSPLLDHQFVNLAARIPSRMKLRGREGKYIFKRAMIGMLPSRVLDRRKRGFVAPIAEWFRRDLKDMANSVLFDKSSYDGLIDRAALAHLWNFHQAGHRDYSRPLWAVFMFRMWQKNFG